MKHQPMFIFFIATTCSKIYFMMAFELLLFFTFSETPKISPASLTKYSKSLFSHLFVNWASLTFYWANSSSRSNNSKEGFDSSLNTGGNTPGANPTIKTMIYQTMELQIEEQLTSMLHVSPPSSWRGQQFQGLTRSHT